MLGAPRRPLVGFAVALAAIAVTVTAPPALAVDSSVAAMTAPVYVRVNPVTQANLATTWSDEATKSAGYGFTTELGTPFFAARGASAGLSAVQGMYKSANADFAYAIVGSPAYTSLAASGYADQGTAFYAAGQGVGTDTVPVSSYLKAGHRRLAVVGSSSAGDLVAGGWVAEYTAFQVPSATAARASAKLTRPLTLPSDLPPDPVVTTPPPTTSTTPTPPPPVTSGTARSITTPTTAGSLPVGAATYPIPAKAVFASPNGNDANAGTEASPVQTVSRAVALAPAGSTVVLRGGVYHESVTVLKSLTIQSYPGEAVWLDGSEPVSGWVADGATWRHDGWTTRFDASPTYTQGAADSTSADWQFVSPNYPMASHPDQMFVDGVALRQVASRAAVTSGTFFLDEGTSQLYIGSNPAGHDISASTLIRSLMLRAPDITVRGIGTRRYSPSVFHIASLTMEAPRGHLENVVVEDSATTGVAAIREDDTIVNVTIRRSGMLGLHARYADRIVVDGLLSTQNNVEHFNTAPVSGGAKFGATRGITVRNSVFSDNIGPGFWEDCSNYDSVFSNNTFRNNTGHGLFLELSAKAVVAGNLFSNNGVSAMKVNNTSDVQIWNNTFLGNGRPLNLLQDSRRNTNPSDQAVDKRQPFPDPTMPWTLGPITVRNNVVAQSNSNADCLVCVEDYSAKTTAEQMGVTLNGDVYQRSSASAPTWFSLWSRGAINPHPYTLTSLASFQATTGQETSSQEFVGASIVDPTGALVNSVVALEGSIAQPLPASIAALIGHQSGERRLGAW